MKKKERQRIKKANKLLLSALIIGALSSTSAFAYDTPYSVTEVTQDVPYTYQESIIDADGKPQVHYYRVDIIPSVLDSARIKWSTSPIESQTGKVDYTITNSGSQVSLYYKDDNQNTSGRKDSLSVNVGSPDNVYLFKNIPYQSDGGGAIYIYGNNVTIYADFILNGASSGGGILNKFGNNVNIYGSFVSNGAGDAGAGIANEMRINKIGGIFVNNNAREGGAVANNHPGWSEIESIDGIFINNIANNGEGGAILNDVKIGNLTGYYISNFAKQHGGAIMNRKDIINLKNAEFIYNHTSNDDIYCGGAIYNKADAFIQFIDNSKFIGNSTNEYGGAIYNDGRIDNISNTSFINNKVNYSVGDGGAIANVHNAHINNITGSVFKNNSAPGSGGAIFSSGGDGRIDNIENNTFIQNGVGGAGGAICNVSTTLPEIKNNIFNGNTASSGGAISNSRAGYITSIIGNTFINNYSSVRGGVIYNTSIENGVSSSIGKIAGTFIANSSGSIGGVICNLENRTDEYGSPATIGSVSGTFIGNYAQNGGAIWNDSNITIKAEDSNTVFEGNYVTNANGKGGALYNFGGATLNTSAGKEITFVGGEDTSTQKDIDGVYNIGSINITGNGSVNFSSVTNSENKGTLTVSGGTVSAKKNISQGTLDVKSGATLDLAKGQINRVDVNTLNFENGAKLKLDVGNNQIDSLSYTNSDSNITVAVNSINLIGDINNTTTSLTWLSGTGGNVIDNTSSITAATKNAVYNFTKATNGVLNVVKSEALSLPVIIRNYPEITSYSIIDGDETMTADLGTLNGTNRIFTINGNEHSLLGGNYAGITVQSGQTLTLNNVNMKNFKTTTNGGAIYNSGATNIEAENSDIIFDGNYVTTGNGGAIYNSGTVGLYAGEEHSITFTGGSETGTQKDIDGIYNAGTLNINGDENAAHKTIGRVNLYTVNGEGTTNIYDGITTIADAGGITQKDLTISSGATLESKADNLHITNAIQNSGILNLKGGTSTTSRAIISSIVSGSGTTNFGNGTNNAYIQVDSAINQAINIKANADVLANANLIGGAVANSGTINLSGNNTTGVLSQSITGGNVVIDGTINSTSSIASAIGINSGKSLSINADNVDGAVTNAGTLNLSGGKLEQNVTGGNVIIDGAVTSNSAITSAIAINGSKSLTIGASNVGGAVTNSGTINLSGNNTTGVLSQSITGGTINITNNSIVSIAANKSVSGNTLALGNGSTLNLINNSYDTISVDTFNAGSTGNLKFDVSASDNDQIQIGTSATGTLNLSGINIVGDLEEGTFRLFTGDGSKEGLTIKQAIVAISGSQSYYKFSQNQNDKGVINISKTSIPEELWTIQDVVAANTKTTTPEQLIEVNVYQLSSNITLDRDLGTLTRYPGKSTRNLTINGTPENKYTIDGNNKKGIIINQGTESTDRLNLTNLTMTGFSSPAVTVGKGDVYLENVTITGNNSTGADIMLKSAINSTVGAYFSGVNTIGNIVLDATSAFSLAFVGLSGTNTVASIVGNANDSGSSVVYVGNDGAVTTVGTIGITGNAGITVDTGAELITTGNVTVANYFGISNEGTITFIGGSKEGETITRAEINASVSGNGNTNFGNGTDAYIQVDEAIRQAINIKANADVQANANLIGGNVTNAGILTLTGDNTTGILSKEITGGNVIIDGTVTSNSAITSATTINENKSLSISADNVKGAVTNAGTINLGAGTLAQAITGEGTIITTGNVLSNASNLDNTVTNTGHTLTLTGDMTGDAPTGALTKAITGTGTTVIDGTVTANAITQSALNINGGKTLTASADNLSISTSLTNDGTLVTHGNLNNLSTLTNNGTVQIATGKELNVKGDKNLGGTLDLNGQTLNMQEQGKTIPVVYSTLTVDTLKGTGDLLIDANVNETNKNSDKIAYSAVENAVINLTNVNVREGFTTHITDAKDNHLTVLVNNGTGSNATFKVGGDTGKTSTQFGNYLYTFEKGTNYGTLKVTEEYNPVTLTEYITSTGKGILIDTYSFADNETLTEGITTGEAKNTYTVGMNGKNLTGNGNGGITIAKEKSLTINGKTGEGANGTISNFATALTNNKYGTLAINNVNFEGNHTNSNVAGAIYNSDKATITNITGNFDGNSTSGFGGAILNAGRIDKVTGNFTNNFVETSGPFSGGGGGAVYNHSNGSINFVAEGSDITFSGNYVTTDRGFGGAIYNGNGAKVGLYAVGETDTITFVGGNETGKYDIDGIYNEMSFCILNINGYIPNSTEENPTPSPVVYSGTVNLQNVSGFGTTNIYGGTVNALANITQSAVNLYDGTLQLGSKADGIAAPTVSNLNILGGTLSALNGSIDNVNINSVDSGAIAYIRFDVDLANIEDGYSKSDTFNITNYGQTLGFESHDVNVISDMNSAYGKIKLSDKKIGVVGRIINSNVAGSQYKYKFNEPNDDGSIDILRGLKVGLYEYVKNAVSDEFPANRTYTMTEDDYIIDGKLGNLNDDVTLLTVDGNQNGIIGNDFGGITVGNGQTLIFQNVGELNSDGSVKSSIRNFITNGAGGFIVTQNGGIVNIENSVISENKAKQYGGAIFNNGGATGQLKISDSAFIDNQAVKDDSNGSGGAIYNFTNVATNILAKDKDVIFRGNISGDGTSGAIYNAGTLGLYAKEGKEITFEGTKDGVASSTADTIFNSGTININGNFESVDYKGIINLVGITGTGTTNIYGGKINANSNFVQTTLNNQGEFNFDATGKTGSVGTLSDATTASGTTNIKAGSFTVNGNATQKEIKVSQNATLTTKGNVTTTSGIANAGTLNILGGSKNTETGVITRAEINSTVSGDGTTNFGNGSNNAYIQVNNAITQAINIKANADVSTNADNICEAVSNSGTLNLTGGALDKTVTGGNVAISGDVTSTASIASEITVNENKSLTISADNVNGAVANAGTLNLSDGKLEQNVTGNGTTNIVESATVSIATEKEVSNLVLGSGSTLDLMTPETTPATSPTYEHIKIGTFNAGSTGKMTFDVGAGANDNDQVTILTSASGTLNLTGIRIDGNDLGDRASVDLFTADNNDKLSGLTINKAIVATDIEGQKYYAFTQNEENKGQLDIYKETQDIRPWTLQEVISANTMTTLPEGDTKLIKDVNTYQLTKDTTLDSNLGTLIEYKNGETPYARTLVINGTKGTNEAYIINGNAHSGITVNSGDTLTLNNVNMENFKKDVGYGAAIENNGTITSITGDFNNNSGVWGGAIENERRITSITGNFTGNTATTGAAIHTTTNSSNIGSIVGNFENNSVSHCGGAINNHEGTINSITGDFINNSATSRGGAINIDKGTLNIKTSAEKQNIVFSGNYVKTNNNYGGAIDISYDGYASTVGLYAGEGHSITFEVGANDTVNNKYDIDGIYNHEKGTLNINGDGNIEHKTTGTVNLQNVAGTGTTNIYGGTVNAKNSFVQGTLHNEATFNFNPTDTTKTGTVTTLSDAETAKGTTNIKAGSFTVNGNATQKAITVSQNATLTTKGDVTTTDGIANNGTLNLLGGTSATSRAIINSTVFGDDTTNGTTNFGDGSNAYVQLNGAINQAMNIKANADVLANANLIGRTVDNLGTLNLTGGTLTQVITGTGTTVLQNDITVTDGVKIAGILDGNSKTLTPVGYGKFSVGGFDGTTNLAINVDMTTTGDSESKKAKDFNLITITSANKENSVLDLKTINVTNLATVPESGEITYDKYVTYLTGNLSGLKLKLNGSETGEINAQVQQGDSNLDYTFSLSTTAGSLNVLVKDISLTLEDFITGATNTPKTEFILNSDYTEKASTIGETELGNGRQDAEALTLYINNQSTLSGLSKTNDGITVAKGITLNVSGQSADKQGTMSGFNTALKVNEGTGNVLNLENMILTGNNTDIENNGTLNLSGPNTIDTIKGVGLTEIKSNTTIINDSIVQNDLIIDTEGGLLIDADGLQISNGVTNNGGIILGDGTLTSNINGMTGKVTINGNVINTASMKGNEIRLFPTTKLTNSNEIVANEIANLGEIENNSLMNATTITNKANGVFTANVGSVVQGNLIGGTINSNGNNIVVGNIQNGEGATNSATLNLNGGTLYMRGDLSVANTKADGGSLNLADGVIRTSDFGTLKLNNNMNLLLDTNLATESIDKIAANQVLGDGKINMILNMPSRIDTVITNPNITLNPIADGSRADLKGVIRHESQTVTTPIFNYQTMYDKETGLMKFVGGGGYEGFNPSVMAGAVAAQVGGYLNQLTSYDNAFEHMDSYMNLTRSQRTAMKMLNRYASAGANLPTYNPNQLADESKGIWFKPYATFEKVNLKGGPNVENTAYGSFVGGDSDLIELKNGWDVMYSAYTSYDGSHQNYDGVSVYQNGGHLGGTATWYKGNFFTGLTANVGASVAEASTMYGTDNMTMLMAGVASKTGYNWELLNSKLIIQPSLLMSYSFVNMFDYTNKAGVAIDSDPLHAIQIAPGLKFIGNLPHGWQPYIGVQMVWNIMDETKFSAANVNLPQLSTRPYFQYGIGVQKRWGGRFSGYLQAMLRNGGRTGIALSAGFRWALGKNVTNGNLKQTNNSVPELPKTKIELSSANK